MVAYLNTLNNHHLVQQLLLFCHHYQQLHDRNHKGPQRIELHQYQSHLTVTKYRSKLSITPSVHKKLMKVKCNNLTKRTRKLCLFQIDIFLRHTNHLRITDTVHIYQKSITLFQTIHTHARAHAHTQKKIVLYFYTRKDNCS